jgi:biotin carboxyl carrier protein
MIYEVTIAGKPHRVEITRSSAGTEIKLDGAPVAADVLQPEPDTLSVLLDGRSFEVRRERAPEGPLALEINGRRVTAEVRDPRSLRSRRAAGDILEGPQRLKASMPGKVVRILAPEGTQVEAGQGVLVVEAMKMQNEVKSPKAGVVAKILAAEGTAVNAGDALAIVE